VYSVCLCLSLSLMPSAQRNETETKQFPNSPETVLFQPKQNDNTAVKRFSQSRSSDIATFVVPRTYSRFGDRTFSVAGPRFWNSFPFKLRQSDLTLHQFHRALKTYSFFDWDSSTYDFCFYCAIQMLLLTYLLTYRRCP